MKMKKSALKKNNGWPRLCVLAFTAWFFPMHAVPVNLNHQPLTKKRLPKTFAAAAFIQGFTLIEVLVALVIVAIALPALLLRMDSMSGAAGHNRTVTMSQWVAENKLQEILLTKELQKIEPRGKEAGDVEMAGNKWDWSVEAVNNDTPEVQGFKVTVRAGPQGEAAASDLVLYLFQ